MLPSGIPYRFVAFEGNIGVGKTTLCERLRDRFGCKLILEQFTDNPFLPVFYQNPERYAFPVELFFMTERHKQLQEHFAQPDLFASFTVADYFFVKTLLFAQNNLKGAELRLFKRLFRILNAGFPQPDLLIYLYRPVPVLLRQIARRGRDIERNISAEYLTGIQQAYLDYLKAETQIPTLLIDLGEADFVRDEQTFEQIAALLSAAHPAGLTRISIAGEQVSGHFDHSS